MPREKYESFIIIILVSPLLPVMSISISRVYVEGLSEDKPEEEKAEEEGNSIKANSIDHM
jgi:hypothetical protein